MNEKLIVACVGFGAAALTAGCGYLANKVRKLTKKLDMTVKELEDTEAKDISKELIEKSVQKAADREVNRYAKAAADESLASIKKEVNCQVEKAVDSALDRIEKDVSDEISDQVAKIDEHALQKRVTEQAEKKILNKFDHALEEKVDEFEDKLNDKMNGFKTKIDGLIGTASDSINLIKEVHDRVAGALSYEKNRDSGKEIKFSLG